jgi:hypothetical protein
MPRGPEGEKRPPTSSETPVMVGRIAIGEIEEIRVTARTPLPWRWGA